MAKNANFCPFLTNFFQSADVCLTIFGPPRSGWDLWFSFRSSVRPIVRSSVCSVEISKTAHRLVLIFGTKLKLDYVKKVTFLFFLKKS